MEQSARPGDTLADRYLLVDLLTESGNGRFWRAEDQVLDRHVALHCIAADDPRAARLTEAARLSATVLDRRILRVLDADQQDGLAYVVNEWGSGTSLDIMVGGEGPLPPRRAAWIVSEVAASLAVAHDQRVPHGRLVPENVLLDQAGSVRLIGFCVDAALLGLPRGDLATDVTDLGGLLYFLLTGRWAGTSETAVPGAMRNDHKLLRPRQVRAGIPRVLDAVCDHVLNPFDAPPAPFQHNLSTARGISDALREYVGDPAGLIEPAPVGGIRGAGALAVPERREHPTQDPEPTLAASPVPGPEEADVPNEPNEPDDPEDTRDAPLEGDTEPGPPPGGDADPDPTLVVPPTPPPAAPGEQTAAMPGTGDTAPEPATGGPGADPAVDVPTQAGMPIFDEAADDVSWLERRTEPPPPPPDLEDPPERPLFAPEPEDGSPARRPRNGGVTTHTDGYWPWDTGTGGGTGSGVIPVTEDDGDDEVPGRSWFRAAALVAVSLLLLVAMVVAYNLGRGKTPLGSEPDASSPTASPTPTEAEPTPFQAAAAGDLDPQADPPEENPDLVPLAIDGDPSTGWRTNRYNDQLGPPPGLKTGVGMYIDLGESQEISRIDLTVAGSPTAVTYFVTDEEPDSVAGLQAVARETVKGGSQRTDLEEPVTGRYLIVWLTRLPAVEGGFRGEVRELVASG